MSNPLKSIGKIFKKVVKVVKKIALPALAIAAVVLTGGAALGVLPGVAAGVGGSAAIASSLGISTGLAGVITSAGTGALLGGVTAAATGKNILKGMTTGGILGAATGGLGQVLRPAAAAGQAATTTASTAGNTLASATAPSLGMDSLTQGSKLLSSAAPSASGGGLGSIVSSGAGAVPNAASAFAPAKSAGVNYAQPIAAPEPLPMEYAMGPESLTARGARAVPVGSSPSYQSLEFGPRTSPELFNAVSQYASMPITPVSTGGGLGSIIGGLGKINPYVGGQLIQGLGGGLMAMQQAKDAKREDRLNRASYEDTSGYFKPGDFGGADYAAPDRNWSWAIDENTGRPYKEYR